MGGILTIRYNWAMKLFKTKVKESEAVRQYFATTAAVVRERWPVFEEKLSFVAGKELPIKNKEWAQYELLLAAVALEIKAINNLFDNSQAKRIEEQIKSFLEETETAEYAAALIPDYLRVFDKAVERAENPIDAVCFVVFNAWFEDGVKDFIDKEGYFSPLMTLQLSEILLVNFAGAWKKLSTEFQLVEG